jgi:hypothetical protein
MEKELCQLCCQAVEPMRNGELKGCSRHGCGLWENMPAADFDRIQKALAMLKRTESGDAVVIEKKGGEWPNTLSWHNDEATLYKGRPSLISDVFKTYQEAAEAWNKQP